MGVYDERTEKWITVTDQKVPDDDSDSLISMHISYTSMLLLFLSLAIEIIDPKKM